MAVGIVKALKPSLDESSSEPPKNRRHLRTRRLFRSTVNL
jgi:hypothetical protein